ncbi:hypothetical protein BDV25DRAFT_162950 [Aspergillus avenaceus]|uniref:Uncharacterized protein n=1 Tax=Aspergillus avenaceus TaxID=36643 RepID=A0A5N6TJE5_ASPAV|nr:hypothetical protein BDV25DRAFT_162950 [Aspergillus avenaceus]
MRWSGLQLDRNPMSLLNHHFATGLTTSSRLMAIVSFLLGSLLVSGVIMIAPRQT